MAIMQLLIYTPKLTPRIRYIFDVIFKDILKIQPLYTSEEKELLAYEGARLCYGPQAIDNIPYFKSTSILLGNRIQEIDIDTIPFGGYTVPFPVTGSALPFDPFAAAFYFITRYEEYLHNAEKHGHFTSARSLQKKLNCLEHPVIDE
ncbi:MAG: hypothetical protein EOP48_27605, partial [Sphingobacteriales bacterium]